jgi:two-component system NtrC family sensor kinase
MDPADRKDKQDWLLDERLLQAQKLASIGELSAGIAHEINNPLAIIRQEAEWMRQLLTKLDAAGLQEVEELRGSLQQIIQAVDRATEVIRSLLDFARKRQPVLQGVDLNRIVADMALLVEKEARHHNIEIVRQFAQDLPLISSDAPQLRQVVLNLLTNAAQAIGRDGVITLTTRAAADGAVRLAVRDSGCGIPPEDLPKIFDPFFTTKPPGQGAGLGLAICHGLIQRLGGEISVASAVGQGTTFTLILPPRPDAESLRHG